MIELRTNPFFPELTTVFAPYFFPITHLLPYKGQMALITDSLNQFIETLNMNKEKPDIIPANYYKPNATIPLGRFVLSPPTPLLRANSSNSFYQLPNVTRDLEARFYIEGDYGFGLGFKGPRRLSEIVWFSVLGFSMFHSCPLILQLQGVGYNTYEDHNKETAAKRFLACIRWEKALVQIVMEWAKLESLPQIYILPSAKNKWVSTEALSLERAYLRYDVTARRMKFRKTEDEIYCFPISDPGSE